MKGENKSPIKISEKSKEFLKKIRLNRIKLDLEETNYNESLELVCDFFKNNNNQYVEMLKSKEGVLK